jgi:hypothetical protein
MKPLRVVVGVWTLGLWVASAGPVEAAWNNVFQVCCHSCRPRVSGYASYSVAAPSACCNPCPPVCTTRYEQRCYYQPVTCYQTKTYYEAVTTYRTSYYYEPVTSYRYSCYFDPCTCTYQQVACPTTCYQLRSQCCPVQSWVQRCCSVPVTSYQKCCYWAPVTCCTPTSGAAASVPVAPAVGAPAPPAVNESLQPTPVYPQQPAQQPPQFNEQQRQTPPPPQIGEKRDGNGNPAVDKYYGPNPSNATPNSFRQPLPPGAVGRPAAPVPPPPPVRLDRIVVGPDARVQGQVVRSDSTPRPGARLSFVSSDRQGPSQTVVANGAGRFDVTLASGGWLVYLTAADGSQVYHSRIEINGNGTQNVTLVSRH